MGRTVIPLLAPRLASGFMRKHVANNVRCCLPIACYCRDQFRRALEIMEKVLGSDHPDTQATRALVQEEAEAASNPSSVGEAEGRPFLVEE